MQVRPVLREWHRDRGVSRSDLDNRVVQPRCDGRHDFINHVTRRQEMLAESLSSLDAHLLIASCAAMSTAASILPASAVPLPAMSSAVP